MIVSDDFATVPEPIRGELKALSVYAKEADSRGADVHITGDAKLVMRGKQPVGVEHWRLPHRWCIELNGELYELDASDGLPQSVEQMLQMLKPQSGECPLCASGKWRLKPGPQH